VRSLARLTAALLIVASAAAFAIGVAMERQSEAAEHAAEQPPATASQVPSTPTPTSTTSPTTTRRPDSDADRQAATTAPAAAAPTTGAPTTTNPAAAAGQADSDADGGHDQDADGGHEAGGEGSPAAEAAEHSELVFGLNLESTPLVVAAVVVSVLLAVAILTLGMPWVAGVIAVVMLAFAALDIREIVHQLGESRLELAAMAILVALLHVLAAVAAGYVARIAYRYRNGATARAG
jgi:cobalamin biosynthesis Mg chelatase CobN